MIKKIFAFTVLFTVAIGIAACGGERSSEETASGTEGANAHGEDAGSETEQSSSGSKESSAQEDSLKEQDSEESPEVGTANEENEFQELVVYFSWSGNTRSVANEIQAQTGADIFEIVPAEPYTDDYDTLLDVAQEEQTEKARPDIEGEIENFQQYDRVYLGFPNWWYGVPMALLSFLENHDLAGKQVYLFCSHGTGGLASSVEIITEALPDSEISDNIFDCYEEDAPDSQEEILQWVRELVY